MLVTLTLKFVVRDYSTGMSWSRNEVLKFLLLFAVGKNGRKLAKEKRALLNIIDNSNSVCNAHFFMAPTIYRTLYKTKKKNSDVYRFSSIQ